MGSDKVEPIDIILVTFNRVRFLKHTVSCIYERTLYPYRLWVVDNASTDDTGRWLKIAKVNGYIHDYITMPKNLGLASGFTAGFQKVKSEFFITTQDDVVPPDLRPCWLERMLHIAKNNPDYGGIAMRIQRVRHREINEYKDIIESGPSLASVFRIQKKTDIEKINGFGNRPHWESTSFVARMTPLKKKFGVTTHIYADHTGFMPDNKGFEEGFTTYHTYAKERITQGKEQPYPDIDPKTNIPLKINTERDAGEQSKRERYWNYWGVDRRRVPKLIPDQKILAKYAEKGRGIDIGCGRIKCHPNAIGIDIFPFKDVSVLADATDLWMFNDNELDFVVSSHAIEHFPDTKSVLREWKRVLKPGGILGIATPDGATRPDTILGCHKVALTIPVMEFIFKELKMKIIKFGNVDGRPEKKAAFYMIVQK
jgi:hypothetical protein